MIGGTLLGLALTYAAIDRPPDFGVVHVGAWIIRPGIGATGADPYSKALVAARGEIPLGAAEGLTLTATTDSAGAGLDLSCTYRIEGVVPPANFWTLTVYRHDGTPGSRDLRSAYTSSEALMSEQGQVTVMLSARPHAGNWIPLTGRGRFELYLRLYDTQTSSSAAALAGGSAPTIRRERCG